MAENYKHLYEQMKKMLIMYQDELIPGFRKKIEELEAKSKWIPVTEPPKERGCYLVTVKHWLDGKPVTREAKWNGADWLSCYGKAEITPRVTHWMPLPEPQMDMPSITENTMNALKRMGEKVHRED